MWFKAFIAIGSLMLISSVTFADKLWVCDQALASILKNEPDSRIAELPWFFNPSLRRVQLYRVFHDGSADQLFQQTRKFKYHLAFEWDDPHIVAHLHVIANAVDYPYITYRIKRDLLSQDSPLTAQNIAYDTHPMSDRALRSFTDAPFGFWINLKTTTFEILKNTGNHWLNHQSNKNVMLMSAPSQ
jgi:hypothetical protein